MTTAGTRELIIDSSPFQSTVPVSSPSHLYLSAQAGGQVGTNQGGNPTSSISLCFVPAQYSWDSCWELVVNLLIEIRTSREEVLAITYLTAEEYGVGTSFEDAILDLLTSLSDYYRSLEARQERLEPQAVEDLKILRGLVRPRPSS